MKNLEIRQIVQRALDHELGLESVFFRIKEELPDSAEPALAAQAKSEGYVNFRAFIDAAASALWAEREQLNSTPLGRRAYKLMRDRLDFKVDALLAFEGAIEKREAIDPGEAPDLIDEAFAEIVQMCGIARELDAGGKGNDHDGKIIRAIFDDLPSELQERARELYPEQVPEV